jgi:hypothetical protein
MGSFVRSFVAIALLCSCDEQFAADPPLNPQSVASASPSDLDAAGAQVPTHAMTITVCSASPNPCRASEGDVSVSYLVVFGSSGRGATRSRGQAAADVFQELRDRTALGARLVATGRTVGDGGVAPTHSTTNASSDPLSTAAVELLDTVDELGEVTIDVVHGSSRCLVSLQSPDDKAPHCLVHDTEHPQPQQQTGGRRH